MARLLAFLVLVLAFGLAILAGLSRFPALAADSRLLMRSGAGLLLIGGFVLLLLTRTRITARRALILALAVFGLCLALAPRVLHRLHPPGLVANTGAPRPQAEHGALITPLAPSATGASQLRTARVRADHSGHFFVEARIEGQPVTFLVDTGATLVALSAADARRIGLDPLPGEFTSEVRTAQGTTRAAPAVLPEIAVGSVRLRNVSAQVLAPGLEISLLGMSFLGRLGGYSVQDGVLDLRE